MTADLFWDAVADQGSPMRGRGAEFETVHGLLDGTQQGQGRMLLVEGEPGTGKLATGALVRTLPSDPGLRLSTPRGC
jgi:hypothetical protein